MRKLLNTLYITSSEYYLSLDGENVIISQSKKEIGRLPLHNLEAIVTCGYAGASPALMEKCAAGNISITFLSPTGRFRAKVTGKAYGNILLRRTQYRMADDKKQTLEIARNFIIGKIYNQRSVINRAQRDYAERLDTEKLSLVSGQLRETLQTVREADTMETLRGNEGEAASRYFSQFNQLILQQKEEFCFDIRNRRPPLDRVNALLSFTYALLTSMCVAALETVGLDPYAGFMHTDRPGRCSLALDLMEELRAPYADRFVLSCINKKMVDSSDFEEKENGAVFLNESGRKKYLAVWQSKKAEKLTHPYLQESIEWGLVPYVQALLLARFIRGDLDGYPPFLWK
ncbi:CRISPR-associated endonuclease Cas1 [Lachnospiraceae bacterium]|jgi:CRISPR-associated protein Cas1|nr:type I-C CRISPR-associated endonuclease Cas1 [Lachnospiraceae bacterium]MCX4272086.1 type I-C CRISPR-associated endonuclease Cas1c [Acetatifactor sp.]GFH94286.1 CRISPR-associated endonuclease Cas1 [Lachnospiraceae bacterium]